ncbi:hypothetical protein BQ8794_10004 [Mesorhizobium prunaredense]|uniref:Uncharacterized protein n=1 Tax=Mesorhizobium prunaredense TaxID=1631249 RepID=A0A1R3V081_9HYPH|nr:hypothetical protein BQ8794_10004 [Mesorhizobium prunaredense]
MLWISHGADLRHGPAAKAAFLPVPLHRGLVLRLTVADDRPTTANLQRLRFAESPRAFFILGRSKERSDAAQTLPKWRVFAAQRQGVPPVSDFSVAEGGLTALGWRLKRTGLRTWRNW